MNVSRMLLPYPKHSPLHFCLILALFALIFVGCSPSTFRTKGIYEARENGYRMEIVAWGSLERDLEFAFAGEYDITFSPLAGGEPLHFSIRYPDKNNPNYSVLTWRNEDGEQVFENLYLDAILSEALLDAGYMLLNEGETEETYFAIEAVASGPTTTIRAADAKYLEVIEIVDNYKGE
ncbi:MAG: hypothetical protein ACRCYY_16185 [Trueperaceae bacterium]